jgi:hypothetical protein
MCEEKSEENDWLMATLTDGGYVEMTGYFDAAEMAPWLGGALSNSPLNEAMAKDCAGAVQEETVTVTFQAEVEFVGVTADAVTEMEPEEQQAMFSVLEEVSAESFFRICPPILGLTPSPFPSHPCAEQSIKKAIAGPAPSEGEDSDGNVVVNIISIGGVLVADLEAALSRMLASEGGGGVVFEIVYILSEDDVAEAEAAAEEGGGGGAVNIGDAVAASVVEAAAESLATVTDPDSCGDMCMSDIMEEAVSEVANTMAEQGIEMPASVIESVEEIEVEPVDMDTFMAAAAESVVTEERVPVFTPAPTATPTEPPEEEEEEADWGAVMPDPTPDPDTTPDSDKETVDDYGEGGESSDYGTEDLFMGEGASSNASLTGIVTFIAILVAFLG